MSTLFDFICLGNKIHSGFSLNEAVESEQDRIRQLDYYLFYDANKENLSGNIKTSISKLSNNNLSFKYKNDGSSNTEKGKIMRLGSIILNEIPQISKLMINPQHRILNLSEVKVDYMPDELTMRKLIFKATKVHEEKTK